MSAICGSAVSTLPDTAAAARDAFDRAAAAIGPRQADLVTMFFTPEHLAGLEEAVMPVAASSALLLGCSAEAVIGDSLEIEEGPALSIWVANVPGIRMIPFHAELSETPDGHAIVGFPLIGEPMNAALLLADGLTFPTQGLISSLNGDHPGLPLIGGQASGGSRAGEHALVLGSQVYSSGAVGTLVTGSPVGSLLSQGCKPVGEPFTVTACDGNVIHELGGKPALDRLKELVSSLPPEDQVMVAANLQVGIAIDEMKSDFEPGDFLIRGMLRANNSTGALAISEVVTIGQTVQFQLRDATTADYDLDFLLEKYEGPKEGALLFTCNGRGTRMFERPHHDVALIEKKLGPIAVGGMFCQGEVGQVGGKNFLHGFTASLALFG